MIDTGAMTMLALRHFSCRSATERGYQRSVNQISSEISFIGVELLPITNGRTTEWITNEKQIIVRKNRQINRVKMYAKLPTAESWFLLLLPLLAWRILLLYLNYLVHGCVSRRQEKHCTMKLNQLNSLFNYSLEYGFWAAFFPSAKLIDCCFFLRVATHWYFCLLIELFKKWIKLPWNQSNARNFQCENYTN